MAGILARKERGNLVLFSLCALLAVAALVLAFVVAGRPARQSLGVTFSTTYARYLGIDPRETFTALLDDVGVRRFRIPVYWSEVEPADGTYRFDDVDWMLSEAAARGASVTLVVGAKVPRWPECYVPAWAQTGAYPFDRSKLDEFLTTTVTRYRSSPAVVRWQVENEPFFQFGMCPNADADQLDREIALVRALDDRPVMLTVSGEWEAWTPSAKPADVLGFSLYRTAWNKAVGYIHYPIPAWFYRVRAALVRSHADDVIISELQTEPWLPAGAHDRAPADWYPLFTAEDLRDNVAYAARTGVSEVDLWGAEWWYYLKVNGEPRLWEEAARLFVRHEDS